jgi:3-dehydroquinate dehydratase-2
VRITVINGPNLNLLGDREPDLYGTTTLEDIASRLREIARELGAELQFVQSNHEGVLIEAIQGLRGTADGAIINAGAYTHTSLALRDAFAAVAVPYVEVDLSNIYAREPERRNSMLASGARGLVCGFGAYGYELALRGLVASLSRRG